MTEEWEWLNNLRQTANVDWAQELTRLKGVDWAARKKQLEEYQRKNMTPGDNEFAEMNLLLSEITQTVLPSSESAHADSLKRDPRSAYEILARLDRRCLGILGTSEKID